MRPEGTPKPLSVLATTVARSYDRRSFSSREPVLSVWPQTPMRVRSAEASVGAMRPSAERPPLLSVDLPTGKVMPSGKVRMTMLPERETMTPVPASC